ncbi:MAG: type II toxin-antitoxin system VapC family toxin [Gemmatimonadales bacterium]
MPRSSERPLLLDTHVWIWLVEGQVHRVGPKVPALVERAATEERLVLSAISWWELGMLLERGRITLAKELTAWISANRTTPGARMEVITPSIALDSARLPDLDHGDPADRVLAATARELDATLVTCDAELIAYGALGHVRVMDARVGG